MKKFLRFTALFLMFISRCIAQVGINADNSAPNSSAMLDVVSTTRGVLLPRMTFLQRDAIASPAEGLLIFCIDCGSNGSLSAFSNGSWRTFQPCAIDGPTAAINGVNQTQIIWNWNIVNGAVGYKWNTINEYSTALDMGNSTSKPETGMTCNTLYTRYVWAYSSCAFSSSFILTQNTSTCNCGQNITINHVAGIVAPVTKTVTYSTVTGIPGEPLKCWIASNLGSDHQAASVDDATEPSAGWYWQFNRKQGYKHDGTNRIPNTTWISSIIENSDWLTLNDPCTIELGSAWRLPTYTEYFNVDNVGAWVNWTQIWNSDLKLHGAGYLYYTNGSLSSRGPYGFYISSTQSSATNVWYLYFHSGYSGMSSYYGREPGYSIRCLRE